VADAAFRDIASEVEPDLGLNPAPETLVTI
jgi:hypothetical protein